MRFMDIIPNNAYTIVYLQDRSDWGLFYVSVYVCAVHKSN